MIQLDRSPLLRALVVTPNGHFGVPRPLRAGIHQGVDYQAAEGDVVVSSTRGKVVRTGFDKPVAEGGGGGGWFVIVGTMAHAPELALEHAGMLKPYEVGYFHLSRVDVVKGQQLEPGATIGLAGSSGTASGGSHLHFQVKYLGDPTGPRYQNPEKLTTLPAPASEPFPSVGWLSLLFFGWKLWRG